MLVKGCGRIGLLLCPLLVLLFIAFDSYQGQSQNAPSLASRGWEKVASQHPILRKPQTHHASNDTTTIPSTHREIFSASTPSQKYFPITFTEHYEGMNPNIIPHPTLPATWIVVAQQQRSDVNNSVWFAELVCNAQFTSTGALECIRPPTILPISVTDGNRDRCDEVDLSYFSENIGPHDARMFYGPNIPYTLFGSQSQHTCFGQWLQDLRTLTDWGHEDYVGGHFRRATDLQRPSSSSSPAYRPVEKNWFVFWDIDGKMYVHYDTAPRRSFARLDDNGAVGKDLAPLAATAGDAQCLASLLPTFDPDTEVGQSDIHQGTNSLSITLCNRADPACKPDASNTFVFTLIQQKHLYDLHPVYEPYVLLFQQRAPFALHAVSRRPLWIHGRRAYTPPREVLEVGEESEFARDGKVRGDDSLAKTEMLYVVSVSWKEQGMKYHGFLDDVLFVAFGIEDEAAGGIDLVAGDLLADLAICGEG